jgi:hypothetical protein
MGAFTRSTFSKRSATAALALFLLVAWMPAVAAPAPKTAGPEATVFFCPSNDLECRLKKMEAFDVTKVRDVWVFVAWKNISPGLHSQQLRFSLKRGEHYQTIESVFTTAAVPGLPAFVQVPKKSQGEPTVMAVLPVAGTYITQHALTGMWEIEVILDGKSITKAKFQLHEPD